jgi:hypothetical protein
MLNSKKPERQRIALTKQKLTGNRRNMKHSKTALTTLSGADR